MAGVHCAVAGAGALPIDINLFLAIKNEDFGAPVVGGFYAGIIDTTRGNIIAADDYQTGLRYALILSPKSLEFPTELDWDSSRGSGESGCFTRWNGLEATNVILAKNNDSRYEAFGHIRSVRTSNPVPDDGGSDWYLPALDELEIINRRFKPTDSSNNISSDNRNFPGQQNDGVNPSSDPVGVAYTSNIPAQTNLVNFQEGNAEAVDRRRYWTSTDANEGGRAWIQRINRGSETGTQFADRKDEPSDIYVRPVRRVVIPGDLI